MNKDDKIKISNEIKYDIETKVFDSFPKLKVRLLFIANKLFESSFVLNSSKELTNNEIKELTEQGYINNSN